MRCDERTRPEVTSGPCRATAVAPREGHPGEPKDTLLAKNGAAGACCGNEMACKGSNVGDLPTNISARDDVTSDDNYGSGNGDGDNVCFSDEPLDRSGRQRQKRQQCRQFRKVRTTEKGKDLAREEQSEEPQLRMRASADQVEAQRESAARGPDEASKPIPLLSQDAESKAEGARLGETMKCSNDIREHSHTTDDDRRRGVEGRRIAAKLQNQRTISSPSSWLCSMRKERN